MIKKVVSLLLVFLMIFSAIITDNVYAIENDNISQWTSNIINSRIKDSYINGYLANPLNLTGSVKMSKDILMINSALRKSEYEDLVIDKPNSVVENKIVENLHITKNVGDGEVTLRNVIVKGELLVEGGGRNSISIEDSTVNKLTTKKEEGKVRILIEGNTSVDLTSVKSSAILEQQKLTGLGFDEIKVEKDTSLALTIDKNATWSSSDKNVATISSKGIVTAKKIGTTNISIISKYGNKIEICKVAVVEENSDSDYENDTNTIKILSIGNSFSEDAVYHLYDIAKSAGVNVIVGNVYLSGCSLKTHWANALSNNTAYTYYKWTSPSVTKIEKQSMKSCILDEKWDFITFQQASVDSGIYSTFQPYLNNLVEYAKGLSTNSSVKFALHMTWAYAEDSTNVNFVNYNNDQKIMYSSIINAYKQAAMETGIDIVIPCATAIQNARTNSQLRAVGDELTLDGYHLNEGIGRYIAGLTYFETLIINNSDINKNLVGDVTYIPNTIDSTEQLSSLAKMAVKNALQNPYKITKVGQ